MKIPQVMKPKKVEDLEQFMGNDEYLMEPKFDGYRMLVSRDPDSKAIRVFTRLGHEKTQNVPHIVKELEDWLQPGIWLDGEIISPSSYYEGLPVTSDFNKVKRIMGSELPGVAVEKQGELGLLHYSVFDFLPSAWVFEDRRRWLEADFPRDLYYSRLTMNVPPSNSLLEIMLNEQAEGVVFKRVGGKYIGGKRPAHNWYKWKKKDSIDAVVIGFTLPDKYNEKGEMTWLWSEGLIGAVEFGQYIDGVLVKRGQASGMDVMTRRNMSRNRESWLGQVVEIQHMGLTEVSLRHPQFLRVRTDKKPEECIWDT